MVEETILLSNIKKDKQKRLIKIRPLTDLLINETNLSSNDGSEEISLHLRLERAKQELYNLEQQKEILLAKLHEEINIERDTLEIEKEEALHSAREQGYNDGLAKGREEGLFQYQLLLEKANNIIQSAEAQYKKKIKKSEASIAHLSVKIAEKILNDTLMQDVNSYIPLVKKAIESLKENLSFAIYLHPSKYGVLLNRKEELYDLVEGEASISLYVDHQLKENSCLIEHASGKIDASVDTQLSEIKHVFSQLMERDV